MRNDCNFLTFLILKPQIWRTRFRPGATKCYSVVLMLTVIPYVLVPLEVIRISCTNTLIRLQSGVGFFADRLVNTLNKLPHPGVDFKSLTSIRRTLEMLTFEMKIIVTAGAHYKSTTTMSNTRVDDSVEHVTLMLSSFINWQQIEHSTLTCC